jgi:hypothetical protein
MNCARRGIRWAGVVLAVIALACVREAHAQSDVEAFDRGLAALRAGQNQQAVDAFEAAYRLAPRPLTLVNLGIAYTQLGRVEDALAALDAYLRYADPERDAKNLAAVRAEVERLRAQPGPHRPEAGAPAPTTATLPPATPTDATLTPSAVGSAAPAPRTPGTDAPCALGETCLGPVLALGLPNVLGGGLQVRAGHYFGAGLGFQVLPTIPIFDLGSVSGTLFTVEGRVYPLGGAFFLAGGFAYQSIKATVERPALSAEAHVHVPALFAGIGFMGHDGAVLGIDLGLLVPLASTTVAVRAMAQSPAGTDPSLVAQAERDAKNSVKGVVDWLPVLLQLNAVRFGYLF